MRLVLQMAQESPREADQTAGDRLAEEAKQFLLGLARRTLLDCVAGRPAPEPMEADMPPIVLAPGACFVTLTRHGGLRGCIGRIKPTQPLWRAVIEATAGAALRDPRFPAVHGGELAEITIEMSVLGEAKPLIYASPEELLDQIRLGVDGLLLTLGDRTSTFLPKVWKTIPDKVRFLEQLSLKAGHDRQAWRRGEAVVSAYQTWDFQET